MIEGRKRGLFLPFGGQFLYHAEGHRDAANQCHHPQPDVGNGEPVCRWIAQGSSPFVTAQLQTKGRIDGKGVRLGGGFAYGDRKSTRLNSSHLGISYAVFCLKK